MNRRRSQKFGLRIVQPDERRPVDHPSGCDRDGLAPINGREHQGVAEELLPDHDNAVVTLQAGRFDQHDGRDIVTEFVRLTIRHLALMDARVDIETDADDLAHLIRVATRQLAVIAAS